MARGNSWLRDWLTVIMGLRAVPKGKSYVSAAEMVFGCTIRLPGEFYSLNSEAQDKSMFAQQLHQCIRKLAPIPFGHHEKQNVFVHRDLDTCEKVYLRLDRVRQPLEPPYGGPFRVTKRRKKFFIIDKDGVLESVSVDRLKPAYEINSNLTEEGYGNAIRKSILKNKQWTDVSNNNHVSKPKKVYLYKKRFCDPLLQNVDVDPKPLGSISNDCYQTTSGRQVKPPVRFRL